MLRTREEFFSLKLSYDGDRLELAVLDGKELELLDLPDEKGNQSWREIQD